MNFFFQSSLLPCVLGLVSRVGLDLRACVSSVPSP